MPSLYYRPRPQSTALAVLALVLALGWASREHSFAAQKEAILKSQTVTLDQVKMTDVPTGEASSAS